LTVDKIASSMQFVFAVSANYFLEIAKLRAARILWAKIVEQYNPSEGCSMKMLIHATSSIWNKTVYDPYVNMLRNTTEAMSAAIGGADSITVLPIDSVYKQSDEFTIRNARNTQLLLKEESYLNKIVDPAAGSYYIETLTDGISEKAWEHFKYIESKGGFIKLFESGMIKEEIENACQQRDIDIAKRNVKILGTNQYPNIKDQMLEKITKEISGKRNQNGLRFYRGSESFEMLRLSTEKYHRKTGNKPKVFLLPMGNLAMRKARATFAINFFGCAGYEIIDNNQFKNAKEGVKAVLNSAADIVVICSSDEEYPSIVPSICDGIKKANEKVKVIVAGYPKESIEILTNAGVDDFIHLKTNVLGFLMNYQDQLGVIKKVI
ncbi:methylmalonyl-CoA mutase family protein, partial [candidate division KSB1 bacterium]